MAMECAQRAISSFGLAGAFVGMARREGRNRRAEQNPERVGFVVASLADCLRVGNTSAGIGLHARLTLDRDVESGCSHLSVCGGTSMRVASHDLEWESSITWSKASPLNVF